MSSACNNRLEEAERSESRGWKRVAAFWAGWLLWQVQPPVFFNASSQSIAYFCTHHNNRETPEERDNRR